MSGGRYSGTGSYGYEFIDIALLRIKEVNCMSSESTLWLVADAGWIEGTPYPALRYPVPGAWDKSLQAKHQANSA